MRLPSWKPGLSGLICLPDHTDKHRPRSYFVADVDEKGMYTAKTSLIKWSEAYYHRMTEFAEKERKTAFATLYLDDYDKWVSLGYLKEK
jgi:hypothetical protein